MKILANENVPRAAIEALVEAGHDMVWAHSEMPGSTDTAILTRAQSEQRIVLTFDKDFGEMAFSKGQTVDSGVILIRIRFAHPAAAASRIVEILGSREDWSGYFWVVEKNRIRSRPLSRHL